MRMRSIWKTFEKRDTYKGRCIDMMPPGLFVFPCTTFSNGAPGMRYFLFARDGHIKRMEDVRYNHDATEMVL
jgi:hypothetical protein